MHFPTVSKQTTFQTIGRHHRKRILTDREARALNQHQQYARHEEHGSESQVIVVHTKQRQNVDYCTYNERGFDIMAIKGQSVKAMSELYMEGQGKRTCRTRDQRSGEQVKRGRTRRASKRDTKLANSQRNRYSQRTNAEELRKPNQNQWRRYPIPNTAQEGQLERRKMTVAAGQKTLPPVNEADLDSKHKADEYESGERHGSMANKADKYESGERHKNMANKADENIFYEANHYM